MEQTLDTLDGPAMCGGFSVIYDPDVPPGSPRPDPVIVKLYENECCHVGFVVQPKAPAAHWPLYLRVREGVTFRLAYDAVTAIQGVQGRFKQS
jgi:hypothetical protein